MKKRVLSVLLAAAMLSTLLAGCEKKPEAAADGTEAASGDVVTIGVFEPASGDNGAVGIHRDQRADDMRPGHGRLYGFDAEGLPHSPLELGGGVG